MTLIFRSGGSMLATDKTYIKRNADQYALQTALNGDYLYVIAPRQMGKTSLFKYLAHQLNDKGWRCAKIDLSTLTDLPKIKWYTALGKLLARTLTQNQIPSLTNQIDLHYYLIDTALSQSGRQSHIALFFDEVEGVKKACDEHGHPFSNTFFNTLRNLYNDRDSYQGTLVVGLAGAIRPNDLVSDTTISPFNVAQEISLDDFTLAESRQLTNHLNNLGLAVDETIHQTIYSWTSGHPYLTHQLCFELQKAATEKTISRISTKAVLDIINQKMLNPSNPVNRDKNLNHVSKMLANLSSVSAQIWAKLKNGQQIKHQEIGEATDFELYLTGAIKKDNEYLVLRNKIYKHIFASSHIQKPLSSRLKHLQQQKAELEKVWDNLSERIAAVQKDLSTAMDSEQKVTLEARLKEHEEKRDEVAHKLEAIEQEINQL